MIIVILRAWPFVLDEQVQPVVMTAFRPMNVAGLNIVSYRSLLWWYNCAIFRVQLVMLMHYWTSFHVSILLLLYLE